MILANSRQLGRATRTARATVVLCAVTCYLFIASYGVACSLLHGGTDPHQMSNHATHESLCSSASCGAAVIAADHQPVLADRPHVRGVLLSGADTRPAASRVFPFSTRAPPRHTT